jgi:hypothetical protein
VFGWKGDTLQKAMDASCFGATCAPLKTQTFNEANKCAIKNSVNEPVDGCESQHVNFRKGYLLICCVLRAHQSPGYDQSSWEEVDNHWINRLALK